jgi:hypothetical protein
MSADRGRKESTAAGFRVRILTISAAASDFAIGSGQLRSSEIISARQCSHAFSEPE